MNYIKNFCLGWFIGSALMTIAFGLLRIDNKLIFEEGAVALLVAVVIHTFCTEKK